VVDDWSRLIEQAGLRGPVGQLAQHAALLGVEGNTLRLALKADHDHLHSAPMVSMLEERLGAALGRAIRVTFEKTRPGMETPADLAARSRGEQQQEAERALEADPFVQAVMRDLGGRIVPNSVRPPDGNV
jgi:DNA polymerase-3 subunit gamma/tau